MLVLFVEQKEAVSQKYAYVQTINLYGWAFIVDRYIIREFFDEMMGYWSIFSGIESNQVAFSFAISGARYECEAIIYMRIYVCTYCVYWKLI